DLYGTVYDQAYFKRCQQAAAELPPNASVTFHGHIAHDQVARAIGEAHAVLMPSVGENFGHTMLEALVAGRPLLISDRTPWKHLEAQRAGWDLPLEEPERFEAAIRALTAMDQAEYDAWAAGAAALGKRYLADAAGLEQSLALFTR
ncbi:MAG: glycosyltransferase, partial [Flavobacteriales bacterium]